MHQFKIGDFGSTTHRSDQTPCVVVKVSASGKTIKVRRVRYALKAEHRGKCFGQDITEDMVQDIEAVGDDYDDGDVVDTYRFTIRRGQAAFRGPGGRLTAGFLSYRDPSF